MEHLALCEWLGLRYVLCFVKPGFSLYYFKEVNYDPQRKSVNVMVPMRLIRGEAPLKSLELERTVVGAPMKEMSAVAPGGSPAL